MKIAIVNDMPMAVEALRRALAFEPAHQVVWVAGNGAEAVQRCAEQTPDLILMDLIMPVMDGVEATRRIMAETPCAIVIVTVDRQQNVHRVFEAMGHGPWMWSTRRPWARAMPVSGGAAAAQDPQYRLADRPAAAQRAAPVRTPCVRRPSAAAWWPSARRLAAGGAGSVAQGLPKVSGGHRAGPARRPGVRRRHGRMAAAASGLPVRLAREGEPPQPGQVLLAGTNHHSPAAKRHAGLHRRAGQ
jgi:two-component system response regulator WspF